MRINFIRHGKTFGNLKRSYVGSTDDVLCMEGIVLLKSKKYPDCELLAVSPMTRCIQTAGLIYPKKPYIVCEDFRECDFGDFEGKTYEELKDNPDYIKWCENAWGVTVPNGEDSNLFKERCVKEFEKLMKDIDDSKTLSLVVHGGTIMSILERFEENHKGFYDYHTTNGCGYVTEYNNGVIRIIEEI